MPPTSFGIYLLWMDSHNPLHFSFSVVLKNFSLSFNLQSLAVHAFLFYFSASVEPEIGVDTKVSQQVKFLVEPQSSLKSISDLVWSTLLLWQS